MQAPSHIQPVAVPQQPVIVANTQPNGKTYEAYKATASVRLGALQIVIGILCILCNVGAILLEATLSFLGHGFWGGLFFILVGSFGISAGKYRTSCPIVAFMVLSIIAEIPALCVLSISAIGLAEDNYYTYSYYYSDYYSDSRDTRVAMNALLIALAILEAIIAIWSSAICCGAVCCGNKTGPANIAQEAQYINQPGQQQVPTSNPGQPGFSAGQPGFTAGQQGFTAGQPGFIAGQPGFIAGQPGFTAGQPGFSAGQPGFTAGQPGFTAGQPGFTAGQPGFIAGQPGFIAGQPGGAMVSQQYTTYPYQTQAWALPPNQVPGIYFVQTGPPQMALPQGVTPPGHITYSHLGVTPPGHITDSSQEITAPGHITDSPPGGPSRVPAPQT